jgi:hypothetical protein
MPCLFGLTTTSGTSTASDLAEAIRYALRRWFGLLVFLDDGRVEMDTNTVERALRTITLNLKNASSAKRHSRRFSSYRVTLRVRGALPHDCRVPWSSVLTHPLLSPSMRRRKETPPSRFDQHSPCRAAPGICKHANPGGVCNRRSASDGTSPVPMAA